MRLTSTAYAEGETMPDRFATVNVPGGRGVSVPLEWEGAPGGTRSFVLALIDHHPVARGWVHWLVTDIPAETTALAEGDSTTAMPSGSRELLNTGDRRGYGGPQPPVGSGVHDYETTIYALDVPGLALDDRAGWDDVRRSMEGHVLDSASLIGRFGR